jgi:hypothetical protein
VISRRHHAPALLTTLNERLKEAILEMVSATPEQHLRPNALKKALAHKLGASGHPVQEAVKNLVEKGRLTFTYRHPTSYLEIPGPVSWPADTCQSAFLSARLGTSRPSDLIFRKRVVLWMPSWRAVCSRFQLFRRSALIRKAASS